MAKRIALKNDSSDHGGTIITSNQDGSFKVSGVEVAIDGAQHSCPIDGHGVTEIVSVITDVFQNSRLVLTEEAVAGCGAKLTPPDRKVYIDAVFPEASEGFEFSFGSVEFGDLLPLY